eukprot:scaffold377_cov269-Pinguiococcus_pyrenoidosus.AAC.6
MGARGKSPLACVNEGEKNVLLLGCSMSRPRPLSHARSGGSLSEESLPSGAHSHLLGLHEIIFAGSSLDCTSLMPGLDLGIWSSPCLQQPQAFCDMRSSSFLLTTRSAYRALQGSLLAGSRLSHRDSRQSSPLHPLLVSKCSNVSQRSLGSARKQGSSPPAEP